MGAASDAVVSRQATAVLRERGLGAVERAQQLRDYAADVTTAQQKALSGVVSSGDDATADSRGGISGRIRRPDRGNSLLLRQKAKTQAAGNSGAAEAEDEFGEDKPSAGQAFNSRAQFADFDASSATAAGIAAAGSDTRADQSLGSTALGAQRAAAKFKLSTEKVLL